MTFYYKTCFVYSKENRSSSSSLSFFLPFNLSNRTDRVVVNKFGNTGTIKPDLPDKTVLLKKPWKYHQRTNQFDFCSFVALCRIVINRIFYPPILLKNDCMKTRHFLAKIDMYVVLEKYSFYRNVFITGFNIEFHRARNVNV